MGTIPRRWDAGAEGGGIILGCHPGSRDDGYPGSAIRQLISVIEVGPALATLGRDDSGARIIAKVATGGYLSTMTTVSIKEARDRLTALARRVEQGETVVVTRNGKPVFDLVPHRKRGGLDLEGAYERLRQKGITQGTPYVPDDFDDPLPEDFLLKPLP